MRREEKGRNRRVYRSFLYVEKLTLSVCRHYIYRYVLLLELDNHYPKHICGLNFNVMYHRTLKSKRVSCVRQREVCYAGCVHWKKLPYWKDWLEFIDFFLFFPFYREYISWYNYDHSINQILMRMRIRMCDSTWAEQIF